MDKRNGEMLFILNQLFKSGVKLNFLNSLYLKNNFIFKYKWLKYFFKLEQITEMIYLEN
jgi:hypothetical protein